MGSVVNQFIYWEVWVFALEVEYKCFIKAKSNFLITRGKNLVFIMSNSVQMHVKLVVIVRGWYGWNIKIKIDDVSYTYSDMWCVRIWIGHVEMKTEFVFNLPAFISFNLEIKF